MHRPRLVMFYVVAAALIVGLAPGAVEAATSTWSIVRTPNPPVRNGSLAGVSCTSTTACVAVGTHRNSSGLQLGLAEVRHGSEWTVTTVPMPKQALAATLFGVSCLSSRDCFAVGAWVNNGPFEVTLAERWNGSRWSVTPSPNGPSEQNMLLAVSCSTAKFCAAVGSYVTFSNTTQTLAEHWNGSAWSLQTVPLPSGANNSSLAAVSCASASTCMAVGGACLPPTACNVAGGGSTSPFAERWDGTSWTALTPAATSGVGGYLDGVSCPSSLACAAVGSLASFARTNALAEAWDGSAWSLQPTANGSGSLFNSLTSVSCVSGRPCISVGAANERTLAEQLSGTSWTLLPAIDPVGTLGGMLDAVACPATKRCTAVAGPLVEGWNGTHWSIQHAAAPKGSAVGAINLQGVSCSSATACTAVGSYFANIGADLSLAERWNGRSWSVESTPNTPGGGNVELRAVSCPTATSCIAVGASSGFGRCFPTDDPLAERWDGTGWSLSSVPTPAGANCANLTGVSCTSPTFCLAVGSYTDSSFATFTLVEAWNGMAWSIVTTPDPGGKSNQLDAVSCASSSVCAAVGASGFQSLAELWNGTAWSVQTLPNGCCPLTGVSCPTTTSCLGVGGTIAERWDGLGWSFSQPVFPKLGLYYSVIAVSCPSATVCTTVGYAVNAYIPTPMPSSGGISTGGGGSTVTLAENVVSG